MAEKGEKVDPKVIKKTQEILSKIIKKPPLTDKLLQKPPFRFLHDICTSIIKTTGFMRGLFTDAEMNSENVKDKESKMVFLQKAIDIVSLVLGKTISARPNKVVAGHEATKTNEFLQSLAEAVKKKVDNAEYVRQVLKKQGGDDKPTSSKSKKSRESSSDAAKEKHEERKKDEKKEASGKESETADERDRRKSRSRDRRSRPEESADTSKERRSRDREKTKSEPKPGETEKDSKEGKKRKSREDSRGRQRDAKKPEAVVNGEAQPHEEPPPRMPRPTSAKGSRRRHGHGRRRDSSDEDEEQQRLAQEKAKERDKHKDKEMNGTVGEEDLPPQVAAARKMARPGSARPAPPKVKKTDQGFDEPLMSGNVPNVIVDKKGDDSDEDDIFVKEEDDVIPASRPEPPVTQTGNQEDGEHGGLVKKMLESKKELEGGSHQTQILKKTEIERSQVSDAARKKEREMVQKEIEKLRSSIQTLTRSVNPLGKIMDFVQEDLDSMQKELEMWKKENKENAVTLQREQHITDDSLEPLKAQLQELDQAIADQLDLIAASKNNIIQNDAKIEKMLSTVSKS